MYKNNMLISNHRKYHALMPNLSPSLLRLSFLNILTPLIHVQSLIFECPLWRLALRVCVQGFKHHYLRAKSSINVIGLKKIRDSNYILPLLVPRAGQIQRSNAVAWCIECAEAALKIMEGHLYLPPAMCGSMGFDFSAALSDTPITTRSTMATTAWSGWSSCCRVSNLEVY